MPKQLFKKTLIASAIALTSGITTAAPYEIIDLGNLGGTNSFAYGINNAGDIVGFANGPVVEDDDGNLVNEFNLHASQFFQQVNPVDLGVLLEGDSSIAVSINDASLSVGSSFFTNEETGLIEKSAVVFNGNVISELAEKEGLINTEAFSINDNSIIVGSGIYDVDPSDNTDDFTFATTRGFVYNFATNEHVMMIPALSEENTRTSQLTSINNNNMLVGFAGTDEEIFSGTYYNNAFAISLDDPSNVIVFPTADGIETTVFDINNQDIAVGASRTATNTTRTVAYTFQVGVDTELKQLGFLREDFSDSVARAINDQGAVVGRALASAPSIGRYAGFIYENDEMKNLNSLISCSSANEWEIVEATNINNSGWIIGYALKTELDADTGESASEIRAYLLKPTGETEAEVCEVPEEENNSGGSFSMFGLLLLGLFGLRRKVK